MDNLLKHIFIFLILTGHLSAVNLLASPIQKVVIDTDGSPDDLMAITLFLSVKEVEVIGITTSDGVLAPDVAAIRVLGLLQKLGMEDIPVATGIKLNADQPTSREAAMQTRWIDKPLVNAESMPDAVSFLNELLLDDQGPVTYVALGPLTNLGDFLKSRPNQDFDKLNFNLLWLLESSNPYSGFNYERDHVSAENVLVSGLGIEIINENCLASGYNPERVLEALKKSGNFNASYLQRFYSQDETRSWMRVWGNQFTSCLVPVYYLFPEFFSMTPVTGNRRVLSCMEFDPEVIFLVLSDLVNQSYVLEKNIAFSRFPDDPSFYRYDLQTHMHEIIEKYGMDEWKACVITDEFHGHLGIYSIIGAKMGVRARDYFGVGVDKIKVESFAGSRPPLSCLNDGLQVSTGATLGMGTISLKDDGGMRSEAFFTHGKKSIAIRLKPEYQQQIDKDIGRGIVQFGLQHTGYWRMIRQLSINYWKDWDRNKIFEINEIN